MAASRSHNLLQGLQPVSSHETSPFRDLPEKLDKLSTRYLDVTGNRLNFLRNLPQNLPNLNINHNRFTTLPHLPPALSELHCEGNDLTGWHALPPGIEVVVSRKRKWEPLEA